MARHLLSDLKVKNAKCKPGKQFTRFADGGGLYLTAFSTGGKSWQFRYKKPDGKETIATFKAIDGVAEARVEADRLRKIVAAGDDPMVLKKIELAIKIADNAQTFEVTAEDWIKTESRRKKWTKHYIDEVRASFVNHLKPLYPIPVTKILAKMTAPILREVERNTPGVVDRLAQRLHSVMDFAVEEGHLPLNPLPRRTSARIATKHYPAVTALADVGALLRAFDKISADRLIQRKSQSSVQRAHLLLVFTAMRISEVVNAEWKEFDLEAGTWAIPRHRMKRKDATRGPHLVPLPPALLAQMRSWRDEDGKSARFVCPSARSAKRPIHDTLVGLTYCDDLELKGIHSPHSWRAVFKSVCSDAGKAGEVIEAQLDHVVGNAVASAYDRSQRLELRRELMAWYEATIIAARDGATVLPLKKKA